MINYYLKHVCNCLNPRHSMIKVDKNQWRRPSDEQLDRYETNICLTLYTLFRYLL